MSDHDPDAATPYLQPGIIPFRPLELGEIYSGAVNAIRSNPAALIGISLATGAASAAVSAIFTGLFVIDLRVIDQTSPPAAVDLAALAREELVPLIAPFLVVVLIGAVIGLVASAAIPIVVERAARGMDTVPGVALSLSLPRVWRLLLMYLLVTVTAVIGASVVQAASTPDASSCVEVPPETE